MPHTLSAFDRLFETWYPRLVRSIRRRLGSADDAEDVAQEAFVRLLRETPNDAPAWLFAVAGRLAIDQHRATTRRREAAERPHTLLRPSENGAGDFEADEQMLRTERVLAVRAVLRMLAARDRDLLMLHHDGFPYREIASRLGVAPASVGSLLTRAHRRFLTHYETRYGTPSEASNGRDGHHSARHADA